MADKQGQIIEKVSIEGMSSEGKGFARVNGKVVFAPFTVPGDIVDLAIKSSKKNYSEATLREIHLNSPLRTTPPCSHFGVCGGCKWQHIQYAEQLKFKRQIVEDAFARIGKLSFPEIPEVLGCQEIYYYRNKLEFAFTDRKWLTNEEVISGQTFEQRNGLGFHVPGSFSGVLDVSHCYLQAEPSNKIRLAVRDFALKNNYTFFNLSKQHGLLRNLQIRSATTGELMVMPVFFEEDKEKIESLLSFLAAEFPEISSLQYVINPKRNDTIYDLETRVYKGESYIIEQLGDYRFKIGPKSFFQTNSPQAKNLYDTTLAFADLKTTDVIYDLYSGVGSIAIYLSAKCKTAVGIEQVAAAVRDAHENAALNSVTNCSFHEGDVRMVLKREFIEANGKPDAVVVDPPRAGLHEDVANTLLQLAAPKIVYVSCNPATQARDLQLLAEKYDITRIQPVDMFPQTTHIENVVRLDLKN